MELQQEIISGNNYISIAKPTTNGIEYRIEKSITLYTR